MVRRSRGNASPLVCRPHLDIVGVMNRVVTIALSTFALCAPTFGETAPSTSESACFIRSSFTPSDDASSLSVDIMRAGAQGQRSTQGLVYSALGDILRQGTISSGTIALQVDGQCGTALPTVRERLSALTLEYAGTVGGQQLVEVNASWIEISAQEFERINPTPAPVP
ncbi:MAG: hypothetical protein AB7O98_08840 [Hyphomonadaceae bacterium]